MALTRKLRMGMVGGGRGAFIGSVHRMAASLDGRIELVAGCFSSDPETSRLSGRDLRLDPDRVHGSYQEMLRREAALPPDRRIDFVSIVTRNDTHVAIASACLTAGFHVVCDKPLGQSLAQGLELRRVVRKSGRVFALTHNYTGYPMVKEAREMVRAGKLGTIQKIVVEYPQGHAIRALVKGGAANWRTDPAVSGPSNCMADIGTHAENLARYVTGLEIDEVCAELSTFIPGRSLDEDGNVLVRYKGGARGILYASQISTGEENALAIRAYGTKASIEWRQEHPNELVVKQIDGTQVIHRRGSSSLSKAAKANTRLPGGHPEAFIEAFANVYLAAAEAIVDAISGRARDRHYDFPNIDDGVTGMAFVETVVKSSTSKAKWTKFPKL